MCNKKFYASISLAIGPKTKRPKEPYEVSQISKGQKHKQNEHCNHDDYFNTKILTLYFFNLTNFPLIF